MDRNQSEALRDVFDGLRGMEVATAARIPSTERYEVRVIFYADFPVSVGNIEALTPRGVECHAVGKPANRIEFIFS